MSQPPETDPFQRFNALRDELDDMRKQIDAARNSAFDRRKMPDRRAYPRLAPDRRITASSR